MGEDILVPTKCEDWSLNIDFDTKKEFWWNASNSLSIWQCNVHVPNTAEATDEVVWEHYFNYQAGAVYKLCVVCDGPEQNIDFVLCVTCGGTAHSECTVGTSPGDFDSRPFLKKMTDKIRKCSKCAEVEVPARAVKEIGANARRATIRALVSRDEYSPQTIKGLEDVLAAAESGKEDDNKLMERCQTLVASHFQPHASASMMRKEKIASKADGIGVIATKHIPKLTVIGVYPGYEDPLSGEQAKCGRPGPKYSLVDLNCADYFNNVFEEFGKCFTPFINEPNEQEFSNVAWIQEPHRPEGRLSVMTVRDIEPGEEVLIGYGPLYPRCYPHNYDAYAYHSVDGYDDPPCFALWHWTTLEEKDAEFVLYCGYDSKKDIYTYWETEDEAAEAEKAE